jgi:hypothetical protein
MTATSPVPDLVDWYTRGPVVATGSGTDVANQTNLAAHGEFTSAILTTQKDAFNRILGNTDPDMQQFRWALVPALALLALWELGKVVARRYARTADAGSNAHGG